MKHYMLPRTPLLKEASLSAEVFSSPNPKQRSGRKQKCSSKENSDPNTTLQVAMPDSASGKPSPVLTGKMKSPLPPRPPSSNPLKRKLSVDAVSDGGGSSFSSDSGVKVIVRMRPPIKDEDDGETIVEKLSNDSLSINGQTFTFDSVADTEATQLDIFQLIGSPLVENCLAGFNSSVFAYGQTGSGKTFTMWGPANALSVEGPLNDQQGLTPRVLERLFSRINEEQIRHADKQLKYQCRCSFLEIYNEQITDLLEPSQKNLQIREDVKSGVYVENLTEECVSTMKDVIQLLLKGLSNRRTGATSINAESSRSHSVFTCVVESRCKSMADGLSSFKTSRINLVDLAGSERQKLTGAAGERLKEAGNINRSLSQLGNLINILADISQTGKQRHIPYRNSRLTFLLQDSLGGNAKMAMICAISPAQSCKSETFSTLRFAQRAKAIKNKAVVNEVMQDDVNFLREVIRQLKEELLRMKTQGNQTDPSGAYSNGWNARRSLNLLKFSLNHPMACPHVDGDGDAEMEIDEEAVEKFYAEASLQVDAACMEERFQHPVGDAIGHGYVEKQNSEVSDVSMEEGISELDSNETMHVDNVGTSTDVIDNFRISAQDDDRDTPITNPSHCECPEQIALDLLLNGKSPSNPVNDVSTGLPPTEQEANNNCSTGPIESVSPSDLSIVPSDASPVLHSPAPSVSPRIVNNSRKSLKTLSILAASQQDAKTCSDIGHDGQKLSFLKVMEGSCSEALTTRNSMCSAQNLATSLHRGLAILDNHQKSSPLRHSSFRFSYKPAEVNPVIPVEKVDVGVQTCPDADSHEKDTEGNLCSSCKSRTLQKELKEDNENLDLQLVPIDGSLSAERARRQVPKAVEKVLTGAIRREMALEEYCSKQTSEIRHLNRLIQQYKHERECNTIIGQMREEKIIRLENLMDGVLPTEDFVEEEFASLRREHELLKEKYENHPDVLRTTIEMKRLQDELQRYQNFFDIGEREILLEEIQDLRNQLQYYTDGSPRLAQVQSSIKQLAYSCEPSPPPHMSMIQESTEVSAEEKLEQERIKWTEVESKWISLTEELRVELETTRSLVEKLKEELNLEKKCSEELKEAMQLAMKGHARMLEQYADLEEKHMELLARHRNMREGIDDVKKAAARAGVKGTESRFINAVAAQISALKAEKEKERRYLRDENKVLKEQLRDTAEAVQAAGELLVRLKEAEEAVAAAQKRSAEAEERAEKAHRQIEKLKKKHEMDINALNQVIVESHLPKEALQGRNEYHSNEVIYDAEQSHFEDNQEWKEEFKAYYDDPELSKFGEPSSSWFSGYDRCNI